MLINQWVPAAHRGDAIGDSARRIRDLLREAGHDANLYALTIDDALREDVRLFEEPKRAQGELTIFHYALPSPMTEAFARLPGGKILQYHNVTPAAFFAPYDPALFRLATLGRQELASLVGRVDLALGDSEYNRRELEELGFPLTGVMPVAVDLGRLTDAPPVPTLSQILDDGLVNFLFVGRIAPNKRVEDIVRLAEHYKRYVDAYYRFIFVGRYDGVPRYHATVRALVKEFGILPERIVFTGPVPDAELAAYYRAASVYISLSEHEGFCVPLVEAMAMDVPILAYAAGAVPDTLKGAGLQFAPKNLEYAAELLGMLAFEDSVRDPVLDAQRRRLEYFSEASTRRRLDALVASAVSMGRRSGSSHP